MKHTPPFIHLLILLTMTVSLVAATIHIPTFLPHPGTKGGAFNVTTPVHNKSLSSFPRHNTHVFTTSTRRLLVFVGTLQVTAIDAKSFDVVWEYNFGGDPNGASILDDKSGILFFTTSNCESEASSSNRRLVALNATSGAELWYFSPSINSTRTTTNSRYIGPHLQVVGTTDGARRLYTFTPSSILGFNLLTGTVERTSPITRSVKPSVQPLMLCAPRHSAADILVLLLRETHDEKGLGGVVFMAYNVRQEPMRFLYESAPVTNINATWSTMPVAAHCTSIYFDGTEPQLQAPLDPGAKLQLFIIGNMRSPAEQLYSSVIMHRFLLDEEGYTNATKVAVLAKHGALLGGGGETSSSTVVSLHGFIAYNGPLFRETIYAGIHTGNIGIGGNTSILAIHTNTGTVLSGNSYHLPSPEVYPVLQGTSSLVATYTQQHNASSGDSFSDNIVELSNFGEETDLSVQLSKGQLATTLCYPALLGHGTIASVAVVFGQNPHGGITVAKHDDDKDGVRLFATVVFSVFQS